MKIANRLTRQQARQLEDLVLENKTEIENKEYTAKFFSKFATGKLGFEVTIYNAKFAAKCFDLRFKRDSHKQSPISGTNVRTLRLIICSLARDLVALRTAIGEPVCDELKSMTDYDSCIELGKNLRSKV